MSIWSTLFKRKQDQPVEVIDGDGQIEALLTNNAYKYVASRPGFTGVTSDTYRKTFTVRRPAIEEFIARHQLNVEDYGAKHHWLTLHSIGDKWVVRQFYPPEKGPGYDRDFDFATKQEARAALLSKLLGNTQTNVKF
jgi:hypothetical protein